MSPLPVTAVGSNDRYSRYRLWKEQHVPLVYDWLSSRTLSWTHGAVQWGALTHAVMPWGTTNHNNTNINSLNNNTANYNNVNNSNPSHPNSHQPYGTHQQQQQQQHQNYPPSGPTPRQPPPPPIPTAWSMRTLFLAERTNQTVNTSDPNTLLQYDVRVVHELVNKPSDIAKPWVEDGVTSIEREKSGATTNKDFSLRKRILHPGEVNRIRLVCPSVVLTHTDSPNLLLWDMDRQADRKKHETTPSVPNCELTGHMRNAEFAIDVYPTGASASNPCDASIISGGSDHHVCLWRLRDYEAFQGKLAAKTRFSGTSTTLSTLENSSSASASQRFGHSNIVEDVSFRRDDSANILVSVGRDSAMIIWDARTPERPMDKVLRAHDGDINCCDFGGIDGTQIITGGSDKIVRVWDSRKLRDASKRTPLPLRTLRGHRTQITNLSWNRFERNVFASGAEDGEILVWKLGNNNKDVTTNTTTLNGNNICNNNNNPLSTSLKANASPTDVVAAAVKQEESRHSPELMFRHVGHVHADSKITDFDWLPSAADRWCIASLSEAAEPSAGASTLQIWRMSDLIYRDKEDVMEELVQHNERVS